MKIFLLLILLTSIGPAPQKVYSVDASSGQAKQIDSFILENEAKREKNPEGLIFTVGLKDNQTQFHVGEVIRLELSFSSSVAKRFILDSAGYDRSGRLDIDSFVLDRRDGTTDPLYDYFHSGVSGGVGGGLRGMPELSEKPKVLIAELNEWIRFDQPGRYRLYVDSARVTRKRSPEDVTRGERTPVSSNVIEFEILPPNKKWAAQKFDEAVAQLAKPEGDKRPACRTLRFLGTTAAVKQMISQFGHRRQYRGMDSGCDFEYGFGLISSPHRDFVIREMERALTSPEQPITSFFMHIIALATFTSQATPVPPYPEGNEEQIKQWQALMEQRRHSFNQIGLNYLRQLAAAIPQKHEDAKATSLKTLLEYQPNLKATDLAQIRQLFSTLPEVFSRLPLDAQTGLLTYRWKAIANSAMLPVLRDILKQPENSAEAYQQRELRSIAVRRLYELSPVEGRKLILEEIERPHPRVKPDVLRLLPDETLPELDDILATNLERTRERNGSGDADAISNLIERYATAAILARVRNVLETPGVGKWACNTQTPLLAYILRTDPQGGGELLKKATGARGEGFSRCYASTLSDVSKLQMSAELEAIALETLDDSDPEMVSQAASVLGDLGSADVEEKLWRRFEKWHQEMRSQARALTKQDPGLPQYTGSNLSGQAMIEQALRNALSHGTAWLADVEKLKRVRSLCHTDGCRREADTIISGWTPQIYIGLSPFADKPYSISVAQYHLSSIEALKQKLLQFPKGTAFKLIAPGPNGDDTGAEEIVSDLIRFLEEHGMKAERVAQ